MTDCTELQKLMEQTLILHKLPRSIAQHSGEYREQQPEFDFDHFASYLRDCDVAVRAHLGMIEYCYSTQKADQRK